MARIIGAGVLLGAWLAAPVARAHFPPVARAAATPEEAVVGATVTLSGAESFDPDDGPSALSFEWDFDDGTAVETGSEVTHAWDAPGAYHVSLTVSDGLATSVAGLTVYVLPPIASAPATWSTPIALTPDGEMLAVVNPADGSTDSDGRIIRWEWYFGDATTGIGRNVRKTFRYGGTYDVMLLVRDDHGGVGTATTSISVDGPPPGSDAGTPETDGGVPGGDGGVAGGDGGGPGSDGATPGGDGGGGGDRMASGGCGCAAPGSGPAVPPAALSALGLLAVLLRRRTGQRR